jgi:hypothetical protein
VYEYLKEARRRSASEDEIYKYLSAKVNYKDCGVVDQLLFMERTPSKR